MPEKLHAHPIRVNENVGDNNRCRHQQTIIFVVSDKIEVLLLTNKFRRCRAMKTTSGDPYLIAGQRKNLAEHDSVHAEHKQTKHEQ